MKIIGHRGARGLAPENTLAAIEAGITAGADELEIDVRVTLDGVPVLWHDPAAGKLPIASTSYAKLKKLAPHLATLDEALHAIGRRVPVVVEIKPGESVGPIIAVLKKSLAQGWKITDFKIASFSQRTLLAAQQAWPKVSLVVIQSWSGVWAGHRARQLGTKYICMNQRFLWWGFVKSMAKSGYKLSAYPLNDPAKARRWAAHGLYGAVTDYPDRFTERP